MIGKSLKNRLRRVINNSICFILPTLIINFIFLCNISAVEQIDSCKNLKSVQAFLPINCDNISIIDGNTVKINNQEFKFLDFDAPEISQKCKLKDSPYEIFDCGMLAADFLEKLFTHKSMGKDTRCFYYVLDSKGIKYLDCIISKEGHSLGQMMIATGLALPNKNYILNRNKLKGIYDKAFSNNIFPNELNEIYHKIPDKKSKDMFLDELVTFSINALLDGSKEAFSKNTRIYGSYFMKPEDYRKLSFTEKMLENKF